MQRALVEQEEIGVEVGVLAEVLADDGLTDEAPAKYVKRYFLTSKTLSWSSLVLNMD